MSRVGCWNSLLRKCFGFILISLITIFSGRVYAYILILENLSNGYSGCSWIDNGNGTSTVSATINYKSIWDYLGGRKFVSRGILVYTYDREGNLNQSSKVASSVSINNVRYGESFEGVGYVMYHNSGAPWDSVWKFYDPFIANVVATVSNAEIANWPAIGIRAGNFTDGNDVGEVTGVAYVRYGENNGVCTIVTQPEVPPPPVEIAIKMTAPDWSLGELQQGESGKTFSDPANQLCFTYFGSAVSGKRFVINARNANGVVSNRYRLKNVDDASQFVPYSITLNGGASPLSLPNISSVPVSLNSSGKTCFMPTFKTTVDDNVKDGDYNDVLTFTVVTKP
uniref:hypothetical protein n=1 Tax=Burkholderia anthina TaxID=179879 RepID=UPI00158EE8E1|nr:hypothetical protein [Burkholderia anthina]